MGSIQKKSNKPGGGEGVEDILFWKEIVEFLGLLLLRNSRQNEALPLSPGKVVLNLMERPGPKTKTFLITPGNANSFFNWPLEYPHYIFEMYPQESSSPQPCLEFFWNSSNCHATKIVIWLFGWNSPVHRARKTPNRWGGGGVDILFWKPTSGIFRFLSLP